MSFRGWLHRTDAASDGNGVERLAHADPADKNLQRALCAAYGIIGVILQAQGREALKSCQQGLAIVKASPKQMIRAIRVYSAISMVGWVKRSSTPLLARALPTWYALRNTQQLHTGLR